MKKYRLTIFNKKTLIKKLILIINSHKYFIKKYIN